MDQQENRNYLPEDVDNTVKYELYLSKQPDDHLIRQYKQLISNTILDNRHPNCQLNLKAHPTQPNLCIGKRKFDQNIEEEWLIIYILYELSKFDHDLVIQVHDSDGDVLLIEAAEQLPRWLESSRSKDRIFIHKGKLHIIPENVNLKDLQANYAPTLNITHSAANFVREMNKSHPACFSGGGGEIAGGETSQNQNRSSRGPQSRVNTLAEKAIQKAISEQLSCMPDKEAWLSKKFKQLDEIISENNVEDTRNLQEKFNESLTLASVMAMDDEDLRISPIESVSTSSASSSSWLTEQQDD